MKRRTIRLKPIRLMSDRERYQGYDRDKEELLKKRGWLPQEEYQREINRLIRKWKI